MCIIALANCIHQKIVYFLVKHDYCKGSFLGFDLIWLWFSVELSMWVLKFDTQICEIVDFDWHVLFCHFFFVFVFFEIFRLYWFIQIIWYVNLLICCVQCVSSYFSFPFFPVVVVLVVVVWCAGFCNAIFKLWIWCVISAFFKWFILPSKSLYIYVNAKYKEAHKDIYIIFIDLESMWKGSW